MVDCECFMEKKWMDSIGLYRGRNVGRKVGRNVGQNVAER